MMRHLRLRAVQVLHPEGRKDSSEVENEMKKITSTRRITFAGLALWFGIVGCGLLTTSVNAVKTESQSVELESATSANIQIDFPAGELNVQSGAGNLMDASFRYNVDDWQPQVQYSENGTQGELRVSQPGSGQVPVGGEVINEWEIQLNEHLPMDLLISTGAGASQLDLGELDMTSLTVKTGAGTTTVNLDGNWQHDVNVSIEGGVGELKVNLPAEMGVQVEMDTALVTVTVNGLTPAENGYVNEAFGAAPYTLTLSLQAGVGSVTLVAP
jgi:hypothetical protein